MPNVNKAASAVSRGVCWVAAAGLALMMFLTCLDVVLRYFGYPVKGAYDVVALSGAFVIALPIAYTQMQKGHIGIDFIISRFKKGPRRVIDSINCLLNVGVYAVLAWQCTVYGKKLFSVGRVSESIQIPLFPFPYVVAVGCGLMGIILLIEFINLVTQVGEE